MWLHGSCIIDLGELMTNRKRAPQDEFLLAAYDQLGDTSAMHGVQMGFSFLPTKRRGVFKVVLRALVTVPGEPSRQIAKYEIEYPNASVESLPAQLYQATIKIEHLVSQYVSNQVEYVVAAAQEG